jgi:phosphoribosylamine--glycine ligase
MTGGMGAVGPVPWVTRSMLSRIKKNVVSPILETMHKRGKPFTGWLYPGLMLTNSGPKVLEFNVRLGDPETQVLMLLLKSDLVELLMAAAEGKLDTVQPEWHTDRYAVCVVLAAPGYPGATYTRGIRIHGLTEAASISGVQIFNAGIAYQGGQLVSTGGRVLSVCATGASIPEALQKAYSAVDTIWSLPALHYRTDIGIKALQPPTFL